MAVFTGSFLSAELGRHTPVTVVLPHDTCKEPQWGFPVLYLLHGRGDDSRTWLYRSNIERYAAERGLCVVMPDAGLSYYSDMANGERYFSFIMDELPNVLRDTLRVSVRREDTYIAGVAMGGYGALKCSFTRPEQYAGCIALSPVTDIGSAMVSDSEQPGGKQVWRGICGETLRISRDIDLFRLLAESANYASVCPKLYIACGKHDELFEQNLRLKESLDGHRIDFTFEQAAAGHEWGFWDVAIQRGLEIVMSKN